MIAIYAHSMSHTNSVCGKGLCSHSTLSKGRNPTTQTLRPIDIIEGWVLCHHLGWVVQYLVRATIPNPLLEQTPLEQTPLGQTDLKQACQRLANLENAKWYLERELARFPRCTLIPMEPPSITTKQVIKDWGLPFHLGETLFYIKTSLSSYRRKEALECAMEHLGEEIKACKAESGLTRSYDPIIREITDQKSRGGK